MKLFDCEYEKIAFTATDITIVAWPKSGITFLSHVIASIMYDVGGPFTPATLIGELIPDLHIKSRYRRPSWTSCFRGRIVP